MANTAAMADDLGGAVLITGASSGIGEACALYLDKIGFQVFAGVRRQTDAERLQARAGATLTPIILDVTQADSITAAVEAVQAAVGEAGLQGLVNNAGIAVGGPLEFLPVEDLRQQMEVNVIGVMAVTQAFLPLLRTGEGRVVNIGSLSGRVALPLFGPYAASKSALAALSASLRLELQAWDIPVVLIEPGSIQTPIWEKSQARGARLMAHMGETAVALYEPTIEAVTRRAQESGVAGQPPQVVAEAVVNALTLADPAPRMLIGREGWLMSTLGHLPDRWREAILTQALGIPPRPNAGLPVARMPWGVLLGGIAGLAAAGWWLRRRDQATANED